MAIKLKTATDSISEVEDLHGIPSHRMSQNRGLWWPSHAEDRESNSLKNYPYLRIHEKNGSLSDGQP